MFQIIYKVADRQIIAIVHARDFESEEAVALEAKMNNILNNPNLGGVREDYGIALTDHRDEEDGTEIAIDEDCCDINFQWFLIAAYDFAI